MKLGSRKKNRSCSNAASKLRVVLLVQVVVGVVVLVGTVMLTIQMHSMHVRLSDFSNSIDQYMHQQQHGSFSARSTHTTVTSAGMRVDDEVEPILSILRHGGYTDADFGAETMASLPKWSSILKAYGPPKIIGLETCKQYRASVRPEMRNLGVAGNFNTGTNLLHSLLLSNCVEEIGHFGGIFWQVPWGKHYPASHRANHTATHKNSVVLPRYDTTMPIVTTRDPYTWMQSQCRQNYGARFDHNKNACPNIIPYPEDIRTHPRYATMKYIPIHAKYDKGFALKFESLAHMWNEWYSQYVNVTFPAIIVRMEDLVFHAETVIPQLCECVGTRFRGTLLHSASISNQNHGIDLNETMSGLIRSIVRYGNITNRRKGYPSNQLEAARKILDPHLMDLFGYPYEEP